VIQIKMGGEIESPLADDKANEVATEHGGMDQPKTAAKIVSAFATGNGN
jgi:hypothetical protein